MSWDEWEGAPAPATTASADTEQPLGLTSAELSDAWTARLVATAREGDIVAQVRGLVASGADAGVKVELLQKATLGWVAARGDYERDDVAAAYAAVSTAVGAYRASLKGTRIKWPDVVANGQRKGKPVSHSLRNIRALLEAYKARCAYNTMTHRLELDTPAITCAPERRANVEVTWFRHACDRHGMQKDTAGEYLALVADEYHPVRDWIQATTWDGIDRVAQLVDTVTTTDALAPTLIRRWLLQCVAAVTDSSFRPTGVLVFQGPQGCGKTTWFSRLAPPDMRWISTGRHLDPTDRDSVQTITRYWIAELGELDATFRRADVASLKAFIDSPFDVYRSAYAKREEEIPRRTVLCGSVNRPDFLADDTGNRRWWTVRTSAVQWDHGIDLAQLWAQVLVIYMAGEAYRITPAELDELNEQNVGSQRVDPLALDLWDVWEVVDDETLEAVVQRQGMRCLREVIAELPDAHSMGSNYNTTSREVAKMLRAAGALESSGGKAKQLRFAVRKRSEADKITEQRLI